MKASLKIGTILGIPVKIHITFLIILPLFALSFAYVSSTVFGFVLGYNDLPIDALGKFILGLVATILFFVAVLLHELAHSFVALRNGYKISGITLFIFG
jgi:Zn-dependent protease